MRALESQLKHIDQYYERKDPRRLYSQEACNLPDGEYRKLLAEIEKKYNEYGKCNLIPDSIIDLIIVIL